MLNFNVNFTVYFFIFISTFYMLPQSEGASSHFLNVNSWKIFDAKKKVGGGGQASLPSPEAMCLIVTGLLMTV